MEKQCDFHAALKTRAFGTWLRSEMPQDSYVHLSQAMLSCTGAGLEEGERLIKILACLHNCDQERGRGVANVKKRVVLIAGHRV